MMKWLKGNLKRTINGSDGKEYHLPPAEYHFEGDVKCEDVRTLAKEAANISGKKSSILVSQYETACWNNLKEVEKIVPTNKFKFQ
ncbi:MAG TPA: hypothetical protein PKC41_00710 [Chitinophagaceae bacterium]|nr:hypothetical protein [Chitinophagaceae bacterium]